MSKNKTPIEIMRQYRQRTPSPPPPPPTTSVLADHASPDLADMAGQITYLPT